MPEFVESDEAVSIHTMPSVRNQFLARAEGGVLLYLRWPYAWVVIGERVCERRCWAGYALFNRLLGRGDGAVEDIFEMTARETEQGVNS